MREPLILISFAMVLMGTVLVISSAGCQKGAEEVEVQEPLKICENVYSTGEL